jgi:uncharacterized protein (DUF4415 family)
MSDRKKRPPIILDHSDEEEERIQRAIASDPDTSEFTGKTHDRPPPHLRVGRPCGSNKTRVTTMLDNDVIAALKASGEKGWQTRLNATLREALDL